MSSIINPSDKNPDPSPNWKRINPYDFIVYSEEFKKRHFGLSGCAKINWKEETELTEISGESLKALKTLVVDAKAGHYFVSQFICDSEAEGFGNLRLAFCIKQKKSDTEKADTIISCSQYDSKGDLFLLDLKDFKELKEKMANYYKRKSYIYHTYQNEEFEIDKRGRAHEINSEIQTFFNSIKSLYTCFICDEIGLSPAFSEVALKSDSSINLDDPIYDHGSGCCPIG